MPFGNHPVCSQPFLSFIKSDDSRLRMQIQSPWVQEVEACCLFEEPKAELCASRLDAVWKDPYIQERWNRAQQNVGSQILQIQNLARKFAESPTDLYLRNLPEMQEAGAGEAIAKTLLGGALGAFALAMVFQNLAHNSQQTNSWFREGPRVYPESLATLPPARPIPPVRDREPPPRLDPEDLPKSLDRLPPPPIDLPRPRRRPDCDPRQSIPVTDSRGLFLEDVVERFARGASMLYYLWSPSESKYVPVHITEISLPEIIETLPSAEDRINSWMGKGMDRGRSLVIFIAESPDCKVLGTSLGIFKTRQESKLPPYEVFMGGRLWKFPDVDLKIKNLSLAFYFHSILYLNEYGYFNDTSPNRPMITDVDPELLASMRNHLEIDGNAYTQAAIEKIRPRIAWNQVSVQEAIYTLKLIPDTRMPKD